MAAPTKLSGSVCPKKNQDNRIEVNLASGFSANSTNICGIFHARLIVVRRKRESCHGAITFSKPGYDLRHPYRLLSS